MYTYMYMGKNYTLYIKDQRLDDEKNKSGLINDLLAQHYEGLPAHEFGEERTVKERVAIKEPEDILEVFPGAVKFCEHGSDPRFCKFAKPGKECK